MTRWPTSPAAIAASALAPIRLSCAAFASARSVSARAPRTWAENSGKAGCSGASGVFAGVSPHAAAKIEVSIKMRVIGSLLVDEETGRARTTHRRIVQPLELVPVSDSVAATHNMSRHAWVLDPPAGRPDPFGKGHPFSRLIRTRFEPIRTWYERG